MYWILLFYQEQDPKEVDVLKDEIAKLHIKQLYVISNLFNYLGFTVWKLIYM